MTTAFGDGDIDRDGAGEDDRMATEAMGEMEKIAAVCRGNGDCGDGDIDGESEKEDNDGTMETTTETTAATETETTETMMTTETAMMTGEWRR